MLPSAYETETAFLHITMMQCNAHWYFRGKVDKKSQHLVSWPPMDFKNNSRSPLPKPVNAEHFK